MGKFGFVHMTGLNTPGQGPHQSLQFASGSDQAAQALSGSQNLTYDYTNNNLFLSGTMYVSGTLKANVFDAIITTKTEIEASGSTRFGDDATDTHVFTGSVSVVSGATRQHYFKLGAGSHTVAAYDCIIGVSSSAYTSITLPNAATAGIGRIIIIKDEMQGTRPSSRHIAVSASGGQTIDHSATYNLTGDSPALSIYSDGISKWFIY